MTNHRAPARWSQAALRECLLDWNGQMTEAAIRADEREEVARMADDVTALYLVGEGEQVQMRSFGDLIREKP